MSCHGKPALTKTDDFLEKIQTTFDNPPPMCKGKTNIVYILSDPGKPGVRSMGPGVSNYEYYKYDTVV